MPDDLRSMVHINGTGTNRLYLYLAIYFCLIFSILRIFTNFIVSLIGVILVSANELTYNTLLSAPNWDFIPKLFFLLSLLLILLFAPISNFINKKTNNPIPILIVHSMIMFTIIYPVFFIHYRFYSPILILLILISINKIIVDFNTKLFMALASFISLLLIKSPDYLESFFVSGFLKSSQLSKIGYINPQVSLSVVNTDANIQLLIDKDYFNFFEFLGIFSYDIYEKIKFTLNFLLTNNIIFNGPSSNSFMSKYFYGYVFVNPASDIIFIILMMILGLFCISFFKNRNYLKLENQISYVLVLYFFIIISFSRYQLNSFFHVQFIFVLIWFKLIKSLVKSRFRLLKNFKVYGVIFVICILASYILTNNFIYNYTLTKLNSRVDDINFKKFQIESVTTEGSKVFLKVNPDTNISNFLLKIELNNNCISNVVRFKPVYGSGDKKYITGDLRDFENEWMAIENMGASHTSKLVTGILAPSLKKMNSKNFLELEGFQTFASELDCIKTIEYSELDVKSKSLFSYTLILTNERTRINDLNYFLPRSVEIGRPINYSNSMFDSSPVRDLCDDIRSPTGLFNKFPIFSNNFDLISKLASSRDFFTKLELGCASQGAFFSNISSFDIGKAVRNQVVSVKSSGFRGNYLMVLVDKSESYIFKTSEILGAETKIIIPQSGNYNLYMIQVIDDQNSMSYIIPKLDINLSSPSNISIDRIDSFRLLPKF